MSIPSLMVAKVPQLQASALVVTLDRTSLFVSGDERSDGGGVSLTTGFATCSVVGGSGNYSFQWVKTSGSSNIDVRFPTTDSSTFTGVFSTEGTRSAIFECRVTDEDTGLFQISDNRVTITMQLNAFIVVPEPEPIPEPEPEPEPEPDPDPVFDPLLVVATPGTVSASQQLLLGESLQLTTNSSTATPTGGSGNFAFRWARVSGSTAVVINNSTSATTTFSSSSSAADVRVAVFRCTVTDATTGSVVSSNNVTATVTFIAADPVVPELLSVDVIPTFLEGLPLRFGGQQETATTPALVLITPEGLSGVVYQWRRTAGSGSLQIANPTSDSTVFFQTGSFEFTQNATFVCDVTDTINNITLTTPTVSVSIPPSTEGEGGF